MLFVRLSAGADCMFYREAPEIAWRQRLVILQQLQYNQCVCVCAHVCARASMCVCACDGWCVMGSGISVSLCICLSHGSVVSLPMATSGLTMTGTFFLLCCWCSTSPYTKTHTHTTSHNLHCSVADWQGLKCVCSLGFQALFSPNCRPVTVTLCLCLSFISNFSLNRHYRSLFVIEFTFACRWKQ